MFIDFFNKKSNNRQLTEVHWIFCWEFQQLTKIKLYDNKYLINKKCFSKKYKLKRLHCKVFPKKDK